MNVDKAPLVICLALFIAIGVPAAIYAVVRRGTGPGQIELLQRASHRASQPWEEENKALEELSKRVAEFKKEKNEQD
jgi:hypothetical protein